MTSDDAIIKDLEAMKDKLLNYLCYYGGDRLQPFRAQLFEAARGVHGAIAAVKALDTPAESA